MLYLDITAGCDGRILVWGKKKIYPTITMLDIYTRMWGPGRTAKVAVGTDLSVLPTLTHNSPQH